MKKIKYLIILCLITLGLSGCLDDPNSDLAPVPNSAIANEGPITQADIDKYIKILPEIASVEYVDGKSASIIYKKHDLSRQRYTYIKAKIPFCVALKAGVELDFSKLPASLKPTEAEIDLIEVTSKNGHF